MPKTSALVERARDAIHARLAEIEDERKRLERGVAELVGDSRRGRRAGTRRTKAASKSRRARRGRGSARAEEAVRQVAKSPGAGAAEIAKALKMKPNYLYRVLGDLEKEGKVRKDGRRYFPAG